MISAIQDLALLIFCFYIVGSAVMLVTLLAFCREGLFKHPIRHIGLVLQSLYGIHRFIESDEFNADERFR